MVWIFQRPLLQTCPSKKVHVNLLQQVDGESVDLRKKTHQEGDGEAVGETCPMQQRHKQKTHNWFVSLPLCLGETSVPTCVRAYPRAGPGWSAACRGRRWLLRTWWRQADHSSSAVAPTARSERRRCRSKLLDRRPPAGCDPIHAFTSSLKVQIIQF